MTFCICNTFHVEITEVKILFYCSNTADEGSLATLEVSDTSSLFGDFEFLADSSSSLDSLSPELELLSQEIISKGPEQSELELR